MDIAKSTTTRILIKFVILTFVSLVVWLATAEADQPGPSMRTLQSYLTSPTRMRIVETFCTGASRASSATEEDRNLNDQYVAILNSSFQIDGYQSFYAGTILSTNLPMTGVKQCPRFDNTKLAFCSLPDLSQSPSSYYSYSYLFSPAVAAALTAAHQPAAGSQKISFTLNVSFGGQQ